jgi:hypothetical protein
MNLSISKELIMKLIRYGIAAILSLILITLFYFFLCTPLSQKSEDIDSQITSPEHEEEVEALRDQIAAREREIELEKERYARDRDMLLREIETMQEYADQPDEIESAGIETPEIIISGTQSHGGSIIISEGDTFYLAPSRNVDVSRYPTMEMPDAVLADSTFSVLVSLTEQLVTAETVVEEGATTESGQLSLTLPESDFWEIDVILSAPAFKIAGGTNISKIILPRLGNSTMARFDLRARSADQYQSTSKIYATLWHEGMYLAKISREITVLQDSIAFHAIAATGVEDTTSHAGGTSGQLLFSGVNLCSNFQVPDMTVYILENLDATQPNLTSIILNSPFLQPYSGSFYKSPQLSSWLTSKYRSLSQRSARNARPVDGPENREQVKAQSLSYLQGLGKELYTKFAPPAFKDSYWRLMNKLGGSFRTIQIYTNNPDLPWELMIPHRGLPDDDVVFLGTRFRISRWHTTDVGNQFERPPQSLSIRELLVIAPEYSGAVALPGVKQELEVLSVLDGYRRIPGRYDSLRTMVNELPEGIVHFAGHGILETEQEGIYNYQIKLEDFDLDILTWRGLFQQNTASHPLFFFNACDVGQSHQVANFVDGWAPAVLETGASGYVGGLWPLNDKSAAEFAMTFYRMLDERIDSGAVNLADLLRDTRRVFYENGDPTYLAYVYYGDPNLKIVRHSL